MNPAALDGVIAMVGHAGLASLFLPALDKAWQTDPELPGMTALQLHTGEQLYVGFIAALAILHALRARSLAPLAAGVAVAGLVIHVYRRAYRTRP